MSHTGRGTLCGHPRSPLPTPWLALFIIKYVLFTHFYFVSFSFTEEFSFLSFFLTTFSLLLLFDPLLAFSCYFSFYVPSLLSLFFHYFSPSSHFCLKFGVFVKFGISAAMNLCEISPTQKSSHPVFPKNKTGSYMNFCSKRWSLFYMRSCLDAI